MKNLMIRPLLAAVLFVFPASLASGTSGMRFTSTFENIKVQARPGEVLNREFRLRLAPDQPKVHFRSHVEDWWQDETGGRSFYKPPGTLAHSCGPWISLNPVETAVSPGGTLAVRVTVAVPADAQPGGYWCALTVDQLADPLAPRPSGVGMRFLTSISVGIFVDLAPVERRIEVSAVEVSSSQARVRLRNTGQGPTGVEGRMEFLAPGGSEPVATVTLPRVTVLPEPIPTRWMKAALPSTRQLPAGRYLVRVILDAGLEHLIGVQKEMEIRHEPASSVH